MASELRVDKIIPSSGTSIGIGTAGGTINFLGNSQINTTGVITATSFSGSGANLTGLTPSAIRSIANDAASRVLTTDGDGTATAHSEVKIEAYTGGDKRLSINKGTGSAEVPLLVRRTGDSGIIAEFANSSGYGVNIGQNSATGEGYLRTGTGQALVFTTNSGSGIANERLRITSDGKVLIKTTTDVFGGTDFGVKGQISIANDNAYRRAYLSGSNNHLYFWNGSNQPYISSGGSFVNASDQSLKKDITDLSYGIDVLKNLKPRKYKMKVDNKEQIGFIAQEVESVIPEVVDAGDTPDGTEQKGLSYGNLTAVLTKALQEAIAKIEKLEAEVAALKGS